jgi:uncharacterized protein (TIRG00374 family)
VFFEIFLKAIRLKEISKPFDINYSLLEFVKIQTISISFSLITPGRIGEFTKIYLLNEKYKDKLFVSTFICIFERFFDIFILCLFSLVLCLFILNNLFITFLVILLFSLMLLSLYLLYNIEKFQNKINKIFPHKFHNILEIFILNKNKLVSKIFITVVITSLIWIINSYIQLLILNSLEIKKNLILLIGINAIVSIMSILTILPLGIGTMDVSALFLYKNIFSLKTEIILFILNASRTFSIIALLILFIPFIIIQPKIFELKKNNQKF